MDKLLRIIQEQLGLECPVCFDDFFTKKSSTGLTKSVYQCSNGHLICSSCKDKLSRCPVCRSPCPNWNRNRLADIIIDVKIKADDNNGSALCLQCYSHVSASLFNDHLTEAHGSANLNIDRVVVSTKRHCGADLLSCSYSFAYTVDQLMASGGYFPINRPNAGHVLSFRFGSAEFYLQALALAWPNRGPFLFVFTNLPEEEANNVEVCLQIRKPVSLSHRYINVINVSSH